MARELEDVGFAIDRYELTIDAAADDTNPGDDAKAEAHLEAAARLTLDRLEEAARPVLRRLDR